MRRFICIAAAFTLFCTAVHAQDKAARVVRFTGTVTDAKGKPVAGAEILYEGYMKEKDGTSKTPIQTKTDVKGKFVLTWRSGTAVPWDEMTVGAAIHAHKRGYGRATKSTFLVEKVTDSNGNVTCNRSFRLGPGTTFSGRVLNKAREPVEGAIIVPFVETKDGRYWHGHKKMPGLHAKTDAHGRFKFVDVPHPGQVRLTVQAKGYADVSWKAYGKRRAGNAPRTLFRTEDRESEVILRPEVRVTGVLVDGRSGKPVTGWRVDGYTAVGKASAHVDEQGRFMLTGLGAGKCELTATDRRADTQDTGARVVRLRDGKTHDLGEWRLPPLVQLTGRIASEGDGAPVSGAHIRVRHAPDPLAEWWEKTGPRAELRADKNGEFSGWIHPGRHEIKVEAYGYLDYEAAAKTAGETDLSLGDVEIRPGRRLRVHIVDEDGKPVPGALIHEENMFLASWPFHHADKKGRALLLETGPGWRAGQLIEVCAPDKRKVGFLKIPDDIALPAEIRVVLHPAARIRGTVLGTHRKPVPRARVRIRCARLTHSCTVGLDEEILTDDKGAYEFDGLHPDQVYGVSASGPVGELLGGDSRTVSRLGPGMTREVAPLVLPPANLPAGSEVVDWLPEFRP